MADAWSGVAGQNLLKQLGSGPGVQAVGPRHVMRVSVPDDRNVDMVGGTAAGQHGVQLLPGLFTGHHAMHGVGRNTLRGVHSRGVTQSCGGARRS